MLSALTVLACGQAHLLTWTQACSAGRGGAGPQVLQPRFSRTYVSLKYVCIDYLQLLLEAAFVSVSELW